MGRKLRNNLIYKSVLSIVLFFIITPIIYTVFSVFFKDMSFIQELHSIDKPLLLLLFKSAFIAFVIALIATFLGTFLGFLLYKTDMIFKAFFKMAMLIPLFISPYVSAVAWKDFFYLTTNNSTVISSYLGVVFVMIVVFTPLAVLIMGFALSKIDKSIEESAILIAGYKTSLVKVIFPLIKPAFFSSFILIFIFSISEFSVPAFFGVRVFTTEIFTQFSAFYNHSLAILQSGLLVLLCLVLLFFEREYLGDAPFLAFGGKGTDSKIYKLTTYKKFIWLFLFIWFIISVLLPLGTLVYQSFQKGITAFNQAFMLLQNTLLPSIGLALLGGLSIVLLGFIAAYGTVILKKKMLDHVLLLGFAVPSVILGISFIKFYNQPFLQWIYGSYTMIIIGFLAKFSFIASKFIGNAMKQIPKSLDEAAQISGATFVKRLQLITIPLLFPAIFATFIIGFILCLGDLGISIMLYPPGTELISIKVFTIMANAPQNITASMALIVFLLTLFFLVLFTILMKITLKNQKYA